MTTARILLRTLDGALGRVVRAGAWLVLPVALLLFLQWPLREVAGRYSREANDLGQWLFALYVAIALTAATRRGAHLATDAVSHRYSESVRRALAHAVRVLAILPWALFILWAGTDIAVRSVRALERFPDTYNPGYFMIKVAACVLALLLLVQGVIDVADRGSSRGARRGEADA
jgi:TRAP-type mannitol/chloroaromatic compound transport system permease small subunit